MTKTKTFILAAPLALAAGALFSTPAAATPWNQHERLLQEITQLDREIERATRYGYLAPREGHALANQLDNLVRLYDRYAYGGFDRGELTSVSNRLENIEYAFERATRGYAANSRYDRNDRYAYNDRRDRDDRRGRHDRRGRRGN